VVLGHRRRADRVARPVVEAADPGQEAERNRDQADGGDHRPVPDRLPVLEPADDDDDRGADSEEERDHPQTAQVTRHHQAAPAPRRRRRRRLGVKVVLGRDRRQPLPPFDPWTRYCTTASNSCFVRVVPKFGGITPAGYPFSTYLFGSTIDSRTNCSSGTPARRASSASLSRSGPTVPFAPAGVNVWQLPQPFFAKTALPAAPPLGGGGGALPGPGVGVVGWAPPEGTHFFAAKSRPLSTYAQRR